MVVSKYLVTSRLELECCRLVMTEVVIQHELVKMKVRKRLAWILFRRQRISLQNDWGQNESESHIYGTHLK